MAASTATVSVFKEERKGQKRVVYAKVDVTASGSDGASVTAAALGLKSITWAKVCMREKNVSPANSGPLLTGLVPSAEPAQATPGFASLTLFTGEGGASGTYPDSSGDYGVIYLEVEGY